jgi:hemoglobin
MRTLYEQLGGFDRILALCKRWHALCLADPAAAHPFADHELHPQHDERLAAYFSEAFGGPALYTAGYGTEATVQRLHGCNGPHEELDEACIRAFGQALADLEFPETAAARAVSYFRAATEGMRAYADGQPVPEDLTIPFA